MQVSTMQQVRSYKMEYTYEIITAKNASALKRTDINGEVVWIPMNEANADYQCYLRWLENPNAEEAAVPTTIGE